MIKRTTKLKWRRKVRTKKRQVEELSYSTEESIEKHFFKRLAHLFEVRRFVGTWILLFVLLAGIVSVQLKALNNYYLELKPAPGGTYAEGMIGSFSNASPLYATGLVDSTVSKLVFAGLFKQNSTNKIEGDLAESWKVSPDGKVYTVILRPNLKFHDGHQLTSEDVAFTFLTIKNPDAQSPLFHAWQGITIQSPDSRTIVFTLPNPLAPFLSGLTTGIVPMHLLRNIPPPQLRSASFNTTKPVGAGPFRWDTIEIIAKGNEPNQQQIGLSAFNDYQGGSPKIKQFIVRTYADESRLVDSFQKQQVNSIIGLERIPDNLTTSNDIKDYSVPLTATNMAFFRNDSDLLKDTKVRQALVSAVDVPMVVKGLGYPALVSDEPILRGQVGYNATLRQLPFNIEQANKLLDEAGWLRGSGGGTRVKDSKKLILKLYSQNNPDYSYITHKLQQAWQQIGVEVQASLPSDQELQTIISSRGYDVLLYGISIGADPDVFAYWHSSQADPRAPSRLNLSNYKSSVADKSLEGERSRLEPGLRSAKYVPFLQAWRNDAPALALYQPRFLYITRGQLHGFDAKSLNSASERFNNVENWMIRQEPTLKN